MGYDKAAAHLARLADVNSLKKPFTAADEADVIKSILEYLAAFKKEVSGDGDSKLRNSGTLIERLLAGPDDTELTPTELALVEAHLKQPISLSTIQQEKQTTGQSETQAERNKLTLIRDFNRNLQAAQPTDELPAKVTASNPAPATTVEEGKGRADDQAVVRLLNIFTNGLADERLEDMKGILDNDNLSTDEKLQKIDALIPIPPTVSAEKLGKVLGVSKQAIQKTSWYDQKRKGRKNLDAAQRHDVYRQRGKQYEADPGENDDY